MIMFATVGTIGQPDDSWSFSEAIIKAPVVLCLEVVHYAFFQAQCVLIR
jgi:hypothetical protein